MHADQVRTGAFHLDGTDVIVGVIDTGIDIYHQCFRKDNGTTRILALLDRSIHSEYIEIVGGPSSGDFQLSYSAPGGTTHQRDDGDPDHRNGCAGPDRARGSSIDQSRRHLNREETAAEHARADRVAKAAPRSQRAIRVHPLPWLEPHRRHQPKCPRHHRPRVHGLQRSMTR